MAREHNRKIERLERELAECRAAREAAESTVAWACPYCRWIGPEGHAGRAGNGPPICPQCLVAGEQVRLVRELPPAPAAIVRVERTEGIPDEGRN